MGRALTRAGLVATALGIQLSVLDTTALPGGSPPNLVLLVVIAVALTGGPMPGLVTGFAAGLALDLAPPADHAIGEYALVCCLVGYFCGLAADEVSRSATLPLAMMALGSLGGSALYTAVGVIFGEADVTWAAARRVLPPSVTYEVLLSPFVLYVVVRLHGLAGRAAVSGGWAAPARPAGVTGRRPPRLRFGSSRSPGSRPGRIGGLAPPHRAHAAAARSGQRRTGGPA